MNRIPSKFRWLVLPLVALSLCFVAGDLNAQAPAKKAPAGKAPAAVPAPAKSATDYGAILNTLKFREIGPAIMGGRIDDFAVVESDPRIFYVCTASGGILKTTNAGTTWTPIFDDQEISTCGDIAIAPSDPSIIYVGTGESNNRQSSSWGNGVYKSTDAGKTWTNVGLKETHHIGRIVVHPTNPNVAYVAAAGHLWGPNKERGVYKTADGGKTWQQVLFVNEDTGVNDVAIDGESPDTLYAAAYQRRRTVFGFNGSGLGSAIYKTTDGGATWKKITKGMPYENGGETGRIGIDIFRRNTNIVYAVIEHAKGGTFRSEDKGETWTRMGDTNPRPMYYSQPRVDPNNDLRIWLMGAPVYFSEDGGKTFVQTRGARIHGDYHAFWIDPANSEHMLAGTDGGIHETHDGGKNWDFINTFPLGQFYEIGVDMAKPYNICGGLQDNNSWCGPSATPYTRGISNDEWTTVGGGDGFYAQIDPTDPSIVYAESQDGNVLRRNMKTRESKSIRPVEMQGEARYRFQWNTPILISAHDPKTIYYPGNFLFKSVNRGDNWTKVSGDLTNGEDRNKKAIMGKVPDKDTMSRHDGVQQWPTSTTVAESAINAKVLWVGTDDGNLHVTKDGGATWKNVADRVPGVPKGTYVSRVIASRTADGTAYAAFDGHRMDDYGVYLFVTTDFGETWKSLGASLPAGSGTIHVVREHPKNPAVLFAGAEFGAYVSFDRGASWTRIKMNLPTVPVDDIQIHPRDNDLIFGTHGRSIWILDDIAPLEQMNEQVAASDWTLFDVRPAIEWRMSNHKGNTGSKLFLGPNPPNGAMIQYYLKNEIKDDAPAAGAQPPAGITGPGGQQIPPEIAAQFGLQVGPQQRTTNKVRITILDADGKEIRTMNGTGQAGINRVTWDLRMTSPIPPAPPGTGGGFGGGGGGGGGGFGGGAGAGSRVDPGKFTVKIKIGDAEQTKSLTVEEDPRVTISAEDRAARRKAISELGPLVRQATLAQRGIVAMRTNLNTAIESWKRPGTPRPPDNVRTAADDLLKKIDELYPLFGTPPAEAPSLGNAGPPIIERAPPLQQRVGQIMGSLEGFTAAPTARQLEDITTLTPLIKDAAEKVQKLMEDLNNLNKMMRDANVPYITMPIGGGGGGGRRPPEDNN